jgi:anaerobic magnesium-protoporphyrin IX monomethyl ester cyclase
MKEKDMVSQNSVKAKKTFLMIVPPNITYNNFRNPTKNTKAWKHKSGIELGVIITDVPLGALTICSWLQREHEMHCKLIDFNVEIHKTWDHISDDSFENWFVEKLSNIGFVPDYIGFSSLFVTGYNNLLTLGKVCRDLYPISTIFVGGNVATTMYKELFEDDVHGAFDALCYGEGELPISDLINAEDPHSYLKNSSSWVTREKALAPSFFAHNFISDLDDIPELDYTLIQLTDYQHSPTIKAYTEIEDKTNYLTYMTSRGCPFLCTFCSAHTVHGRKMRYFSLDRIEKELTFLKKKYFAKTLVLEDDHFLNDNNRAMDILKIARKLGLTCVFPNALALYGLNKEMLLMLSSVGIKQLTLAVESGSPRVLKEIMKKPLKTEITERVAKDCYELGMYTDCNIIIGMPGETMEDIQISRDFLRQLPANWYRINVATPLAGSEMMEMAIKNKQMVGDVREAGYKACVIETEHFKPHEINQVAYELNLELNFVHNTDFIRGNYTRAADAFKNVISLKADHAFAWFFLSKCLKKTGDNVGADEALEIAIYNFRKDPVWNFYFHQFQLKIDGKEIEYNSQHLEDERGIIFKKKSSGIGRQSLEPVSMLSR